MPKKEERFTMEQRRFLAILHDDIDLFNEEFHTKYHDQILTDLTPPVREDEKEKKKRCVYGIDVEDIQREKEMIYIFLSRMDSITSMNPKTEHVQVRSITNKLLNFYPEASHVNINQTNSFKQGFKTLPQLQREKNTLEDREDRDEDDIKRMAVLDEVIDFMVANQMETVEVRSRSDRVTFRVYDDNENIISNRDKPNFFQGGLVVPYTCTIREPMKRQFRSDRVDPRNMVFLTEDYIYIKQKRIPKEEI